MADGIINRFGGRSYTPRGLVNMGPPNASRFDAAEMARLKMLRLEEEARLRAAAMEGKAARGYSGIQPDPANTQVLVQQSNIGPDKGLLEAQEIVKRRAGQAAYDKGRTSFGPDRSKNIGYTPQSLAAKSTQDEFNKWLKMRFLQDLMAGAAGGDPPQPYEVKVGPASRDFVPLNMYGRGFA
jgi:hypothetical protein